MASPLTSLLLAGLSLIAVSPLIPPNGDQLCEQTALFGQSLCVMGTGVTPNRTYSSQVLLTARQLSDNVTAVDRIFEAQPSLRPDMVIYGEGRRSTFLSTSEGLATAYLDFFICSEKTCESVADLKYFQSTAGELGFGFPLGLVPLTDLAVALPIGQEGALTNAVNVSAELSPAVRAKGITSAVRSYNLQGAMPLIENPQVALAGVRVVLESLTDYMLSEPGLGVSFRTISGGCAFLLYPDSAWYRQYILSDLPPCTQPVQTFALTGLSNGSWCYFCDSHSVSVANYQAPCYLSNQGTCGTLDYPTLNPKVGGWILNMYNLTSPEGGQTQYSSEQGVYDHPWTTLLFDIITEGRSEAPAGCNYTDGYTCVGDGCSTEQSFHITCPPATTDSDLSGGFGALLSNLDYQWAFSLNSSIGSFLGYERLNIGGLGQVVNAAESWGYEIVNGVVQNTVLYYDQVLSVTGTATTWLTSFVAIVGAWAAYPQISDFIIKALGSRLWGWQRIIGKFLAGATTIVATSAPLVIVIASQHSLNLNNEKRSQRSYFQAAYDAPGYGAYTLVVIAEVDARARTTNSALSLGLPLLAALLAFDLVAWVLSERVMAKSALEGLERLNSSYSMQSRDLYPV